MNRPINFNRSKCMDGLRKIIKQLTLRIEIVFPVFKLPEIFICCFVYSLLVEKQLEVFRDTKESFQSASRKEREKKQKRSRTKVELGCMPNPALLSLLSQRNTSDVLWLSKKKNLPAMQGDLGLVH